MFKNQSFKLKRRLSLPNIKRLNKHDPKEKLQEAEIKPIPFNDRISIFINKINVAIHQQDQMHEEREEFLRRTEEIQNATERRLKLMNTQTATKEEVTNKRVNNHELKENLQETKTKSRNDRISILRETEEIQQETERRLNLMCTKSAIDEEVVKMWANDPKKASRKSIRKPDRELAIASIMNSNRDQATQAVKRDNDYRKIKFIKVQ